LLRAFDTEATSSPGGLLNPRRVRASGERQQRSATDSSSRLRRGHAATPSRIACDRKLPRRLEPSECGVAERGAISRHASDVINKTPSKLFEREAQSPGSRSYTRL